jgi:GNAT superfamily N-acetyltransferase
MGQVLVRPATEADHPAIRVLGARLAEGAAPWRPAQGFASAASGWVDSTLAGQDDDHPIWVAELDGEVVGVAAASVQRHFSGQADCYLGELMVDAGIEGRGIGRALMRRVEHWARTRGVDAVTLDTGAANQRARAFFAGLGYVEEQVQLTRPIGPEPSRGGE